METVYIVGGGSELQNLDTLLTSEFGVLVKKLDLKSLFLTSEEENLSLKYGVNQLTSLSFFGKNIPLNFLQGDFKSRQTSTISPYSTAFFFNRSLMLSLLLCFFLTIELILVINQQKPMNKRLTKKLSVNSLGIKKGEIRSYKRKPKKLERFLSKRTKELNADLDELSFELDSFEIDNLVTISSILSPLADTKLIFYNGNDQQIDLKIQYKNEENAKSIKNNLKNIFTIVKSQMAKNILTIKLEVTP